MPSDLVGGKNIHLIKFVQLLKPVYLRICAGVQFAEAAMFIVISSILATFDISKPQDSEGRDMDPETTYTTDLLQ